MQWLNLCGHVHVMNIFPNALNAQQVRFCLLAYSPAEESDLQSHEEQSIVLLLTEQECVQVCVDPEWRSKVRTADRGFIEELVSDFARRGRSDPASFFLQTRTLNVGPLITIAEGSLPTDDPRLLDAVQRFVKV